jgi:hypothetical protein
MKVQVISDRQPGLNPLDIGEIGISDGADTFSKQVIEPLECGGRPLHGALDIFSYIIVQCRLVVYAITRLIAV